MPKHQTKPGPPVLRPHQPKSIRGEIRFPTPPKLCCFPGLPAPDRVSFDSEVVIRAADRSQPKLSPLTAPASRAVNRSRPPVPRNCRHCVATTTVRSAVQVSAPRRNEVPHPLDPPSLQPNPKPPSRAAPRSLAGCTSGLNQTPINRSDSSHRCLPEKKRSRSHSHPRSTLPCPRLPRC